jgi:hypothetical protein
MNTLTNLFRRGYELLVAGGAALQSPFLHALRLYFFWQLFLTGKGKLGNIGKVSEFFTSLGIPLPTLNASLSGNAGVALQTLADQKKGVHACKGQNECKGQGGCKSGGGPGQNSCKGKGGCATDGSKKLQ